MAKSSYNHLRVIWEEFRERKVLKVAVVYALMAWGVMQVGDLLFEALQLPPGSHSLLVILVLLGFPMALVLAWAGLAYTYGFEYLNFNHAGGIRRKAVRASKRAMKLILRFTRSPCSARHREDHAKQAQRCS